MIKNSQKHNFLSFSLILTCLLFTSNIFADGYQIKLKATNVKDTTMLLAYHMGHKIFIQDTVDINKKGIAVFEGEEALKPGIYLGVYPGSKYYEFLVPRESDGQRFSIEVDTSDFVNSMKISGSKENEIFNNYQRFLAKQSKEIQALKTSLKDIGEEDKELKKETQNKIESNEKAIFDYRKTLMKDLPDSYTAFLFRSMKEPTAPKAPENEEGETDPFFTFYHIKNHFWDEFDFSDERILRTPIFHNKIEKFLDTYTPKQPDSINIAADIIIENSKANPEMFKY
ncbi:MAG: DUF4369 domain-containing protein, partial [Chitinophagales bacterium]